MQFLVSFNRLTKFFFGIGMIDAWRQAAITKEAHQKSTQLEKNKHLREAVSIAETALAFWSRNPKIWERLTCQLLLGNLLHQLIHNLQIWRQEVAKADKLVAQAKKILQQDHGDPWETQNLTNAITFYQRCNKILYDTQVLETIHNCQQEIKKRQQFQALVKQAQSQAESWYFKNAIAIYSQAEQLYSTQALTQAIATATAQIPQEEIYNASLQKARQGEIEGKLRGAIALLESAVTKFPRTDGRDLLNQLKSLVQGRELFRQGLAAEKAGNFSTAISLYDQASTLLPDQTNCRIRLGIVTIKMQAWKTALCYLENLPGEQAAYLRGFACAQQENLQLAYREWQGISSPNVIQQQEIIKILSQRQRLCALKNIETLVTDSKLEQAKIASKEFIQKFGSDLLVEENLSQHIEPRLEVAIWQDKNWQVITEKTEKIWLDQPHVNSLHNWAVANYYYAQQHSQHLRILTISWSTALANIHQDVLLQDVPWLGNKSVDFNVVFHQLKQQLETFIDTVKDKDIHQYLQLRDCWRLEYIALELMGQPAIKGIKINDVFVTPGCYHHYVSRAQPISIQTIDPQHKILHCLYTNWGLAVAACLTGDSQRAMQLKPINQPSADLEIFAQKLVAYYEGCYYLQQHKWQAAITPFQQAHSEIKINREWQTEIDQLCGLQRQNISEDQEHLAFAQFWYDILASDNSRIYLAEYKAEQVREEVASQKISKQQALQKLERIKLIDAENPVVLDLIQRIEDALSLEVIEEFLDENNLEGAVNYAKKNGKAKIKNVVADVCVDILIDGFKTRKLGFEDIYHLGRWAYELCPDDPSIQEIYIISQELHEIKYFIERDRYEEAIRRAKYAKYDAIRSYVGDYFMMILIKGIQNQQLPAHLVHQIGYWVYELCPDTPDYQEIYHRLNIHSR